MRIKSIFTLVLIVISMTSAIGQTNEDCFTCHGDHAIAPETDRGARLQLFLSADSFAQATHGVLTCTDCHTGDESTFIEVPHLTDAMQTLSCLDCHGEDYTVMSGGYEKSVHALVLKENFSCASCHNPHTVNYAALDTSKIAMIAWYNNQCMSCHTDSVRFSTLADSAIIRDLSHSFLPNKAAHWKYVRCVDCHTPSTESDIHQILPKEQAQHNCVECHSTNTLLARKLYNPANDTTAIAGAGISNYYLFQNAYVIGATRHLAADKIIVGILLLTCAGILIHIILRFVNRHKKTHKSASEDDLYSAGTRLWHMVNALVFIVLLVTGFTMHFASTSSLISFAASVTIHNIAAKILALSYVLFIIGNFTSKNIKHYLPARKAWLARMTAQLRYYLWGIYRGEQPPFTPGKQQKFNPMQQITYLVIMYLFLPLIIISGVMMMFPHLAPDKLFGVGGVGPIAILHYLVTIVLTLFLLVHIYLGSTGKTVGELYMNIMTGNRAARIKSRKDKKHTT
ncbi:MAG TPA: cytochrome b/b6 domain-containing protein [bacterium]|nr:cytochrome b/b6 domain-containing protein [bacterium]HPN42744.1 cytochrome b/b6 domain-containing protein [bacterium]